MTDTTTTEPITFAVVLSAEHATFVLEQVRRLKTICPGMDSDEILASLMVSGAEAVREQPDEVLSEMIDEAIKADGEPHAAE